MSGKILINMPAPEFQLQDFNGNTIKLSNFFGRKNILLVFNRGFV